MTVDWPLFVRRRTRHRYLSAYATRSAPLRRLTNGTPSQLDTAAPDVLSGTLCHTLGVSAHVSDSATYCDANHSPPGDRVWPHPRYVRHVR
jgi:hypothetical protein